MADDPAPDLDPVLRHLDMADRAEIRRTQKMLGRNITAEQRKWAELYIGAARFNAAAACRETGIHISTGYAWRDKREVRLYCAALLAESAARLALSRDAIIAEVARVAMSDIGELLVAIENARETLAREALDGQAASAGTETPENEDGHQRGAQRDRDSNISAGDILRRLGKDITGPVRRLKMGVAHHERFGFVANAETGKLEWRMTEKIPVPYVDEIHLHDKLAALAMLAPWFGLREGVLAEDHDGEESGWHGQQIVAPGIEEE